MDFPFLCLLFHTPSPRPWHSTGLPPTFFPSPTNFTCAKKQRRRSLSQTKPKIKGASPRRPFFFFFDFTCLKNIFHRPAVLFCMRQDAPLRASQCPQYR